MDTELPFDPVDSTSGRALRRMEGKNPDPLRMVVIHSPSTTEQTAHAHAVTLLSFTGSDKSARCSVHES